MIKGLGHRFRPPRLGVIGLGVMVPGKDGKAGHPTEVDYFVLPWRIPGLDERPKVLEVMFPSDDIDTVFPTAYVKYNARKLLTVHCDGETCQEIPPEGPEPPPRACERVPGEACPCGATAKGRLNVVLLNGPVGMYQVTIGGERRCADVLAELAMYRGLLGRLTGVIFTLERVPTPTQIRDAKGNRLSRTGWPVHIRSSITTRQALAIGGQALPGLVPALTAGDHVEGEEEQEAVAGLATMSHDDQGQASFLPPAGPTGHDDEWTIERCYAAAKAIGVESDTYRAFLGKLYGAEPDARALGEQGRTLTRAAKEPAYAATVRARIAARVEGKP